MRSRISAFTLIEMMTVLVLIGVLSALVIPEMKGTFEDALLRSTSRELINVIELASSRAVSLNQTLRVNLDIASGRYQLERLKREGTMENFVPLKEVLHSAGQLDQRITIQIRGAEDNSSGAADGNGSAPEAQGSALLFHPDGTADSAMILLRDRAGFRLALRVNPITSRVVISEPAHE